MTDTPKQPAGQPSKKADAAPIPELYERSLSSIAKPAQPNVRASFDVESGLSGDASEAGTFVSDRKKARPSFFENVASAFVEWRAMMAASIARKRAPEIPAERLQASRTSSDPETERTTQEVPHIATLRSETIARTPHPDEKPVVKRSTTMRDAMPVGSETTRGSEAPALPPAAPLPTGSALHQVRTFKSDAAKMRGTKEEPVPAAAPEPKQEVRPVEVETPAPPAKKKEDIHIVPIDMRSTMIAPEVTERIDLKEVPAAKEALRTPEPVPEIPPTPAAPKQVPPARLEVPERTPQNEAPAGPQWTHLRDIDTADTEMIEVVPPVTIEKRKKGLAEVVTPAVMPAPVPHEPTIPREEPTPHEDRSSRIEERIKDLRSDHTVRTADDAAPLPVGPDVPFTELPLSALKTFVRPAEHTAETISSPTPTPTLIPTPSPEEPVFHTDPSVEHEPVQPASLTPTPPLAPTTQPRQDTGSGVLRFAVRLILLILVIGTCIAGGAYLFTHMEQEPGTTPHEADPVPFTPDAPDMPDEPSHELTLGQDPDVFFTLVERTVGAAPSGIREFAVYAGEPAHRATTQEFFTLSKTTLAPRAVRALEPVFVIGSVTTTRNEPFLQIRSNDFDALFAGLLAWEPMMQQELVPLFGEPGPDTGSFTDAVRDNRSIRILRDAAGNEIMLYSFIDERTVIMTTSAEALAKLIEQF